MEKTERGRALFKDIIQISEQLIGSREYKKTLAIIVESLSRLTGADRSCIMIENQQGQFVIKAGFPPGGHGVNLVLTPAIGEEFLRLVIAQGEVIIVDDPKEDERTRYMRDLAHNYDLSKVVFVPLIYHGDVLGVLTLDFCRGRQEMQLPVDLVMLLANLAAEAIGSEYERRRAKEKVRRMERIHAIGEESARVSHVFKNSLMMIGGHVRRAYRKAQERAAKENDEIVDSLEVVIEEMERLDRTVNGILRFSNPGVLHPEPVMINAFLKETVERAAGDMSVKFYFDDALDVFSISVDIDLMAHAINDLVVNARQAKGTTEIWVRSMFSKKRKSVLIEICNNGEKIKIEIFDDIFSPFVTDKSSGTGLGLANVKSIMASHGGDVRLVKSNETETIFELSLLL